MPIDPIVPDPAADELLAPLLSIMRSLRALHGLKLAEIGLRVGQDDVLLALPQGGTISVGQLAFVVSVRPSTISKMLGNLERDGFVGREAHASDARKSTVRILPKGIEIRAKAQDIRSALNAELLLKVENAAVLSLLLNLDQAVSQKLSRVRV